MENQKMAELGYGGCEFMGVFLPMVVSKYEDDAGKPVIEILLINYRQRYQKKEDAANRAEQDLARAKEEGRKQSDIYERIRAIFAVLKSSHYYPLPQNFPEWEEEWERAAYH